MTPQALIKKLHQEIEKISCEKEGHEIIEKFVQFEINPLNNTLTTQFGTVCCDEYKSKVEAMVFQVLNELQF